MPSKNIFLSKTFWGAIITLVALLFPDLFTLLGLGDSSMLADKIVGLIGGGLTIYGRFVATHAINVLGTGTGK